MKILHTVRAHAHKHVTTHVTTHPIQTGVFILALCGAVYAGFTFSQPRFSETAQPVLRAYTRPLVVEGSVVASSPVDLSFVRDGMIDAYVVSEGATVTPGDMLVTLQSSDVAQSVYRAQTNFNHLSSELSRIQELTSGARSALDEQALLTARNSLSLSQQARSRSAQEHVRELTSLAKTTFAPFFTLSSDGYRFVSTVCNQRLSAEISADRTRLEGSLYEAGKISSTITALSQEHVVLDVWNTTGGLIDQTKNVLISLEVYAKSICDGDAETRTALLAAIARAHTQIKAIEQERVEKEEDIRLRSRVVENIEQDIAGKQASASPDTQETLLERMFTTQEDIRTGLQALAAYRLIAPLYGTVSKHYKQTGDMVSTGESVIRIVPAVEHEVIATATSLDVQRIALGDIANITLASVGQRYVFTGTVADIQEDDNRARIRISFTHKDERIVRGDAAAVEIIHVDDTKRMFVPLRFVRLIGGGQGEVVKQVGRQTVVMKVPVGEITHDGMIEILSSLSVHDTIVK